MVRLRTGRESLSGAFVSEGHPNVSIWEEKTQAVRA